MIILNFRKIFRLESKNNIYKVMDLSWGKTNRFGDYTSFFKSIHYCHFCLWCSDTIQNFRKIIRIDWEEYIQVLGPNWGKMAHCGRNKSFSKHLHLLLLLTHSALWSFREIHTRFWAWSGIKWSFWS